MNYGIVAEFNPFHNGHKYIVDTLKNNGTHTVTAVMSESFVQRGECACLSPYERTRMALACGVDLVLSLPVPYATASAERFAQAGVDVLFSTGVIDKLGFGAECDAAAALVECVAVMMSPLFNECLKRRLGEGNSFPKARQLAFADCGKHRCAEVVSTPNNILGVEYIKALIKSGYADEHNIENMITAVKRTGVDHDSADVSGEICSASALREMLQNNDSFTRFLPDAACDILVQAIRRGKAPADYSKLETAVLYKLRTMNVSDFALLPDVSEGLEYRIYDSVRSGANLTQVLEKIKTKRYTHSRLRRIILCALLGITKDDINLKVPYIRVLGFNATGAKLLGQMKQDSALPIVTRKADAVMLDDSAKRVFELECTARDVFSLALPLPDEAGKEMTEKLIIL